MIASSSQSAYSATLATVSVSQISWSLTASCLVKCT